MSKTLTGDWDKLQRILNSVATGGGGGGGRGGGAIAHASGPSIGRCLKLIEAKVLSHVDNQDLEWAALNAQYAKAKMKKHNMMDDNILYASGQMYDNINVVQEDSFSGMVGVKRGVKSKDGSDVTDIALIHEQPDDDGTKIPPRKLWKPTFEEIKNTVAAELMGTVIKVFKQ